MFTAREQEAINLLVDGVSHFDLAVEMGISKNRVKMILQHARKRAQVHTTIGLTLWFISHKNHAEYYLARYRPLPDHERGHHAQCLCSLCFLKGRQDRRQPG